MDYKAKYEEALERAKRWADGTLQPDKTTPQDVCKTIFPELAESEDEKTRREIIDYLHLAEKGVDDYARPMIDRWIAYLEKLKEPETTSASTMIPSCWEENQKEQKPAEEQDYTGLSDLARAIHRGFLCAGVENVPRKVIEETEIDCIAQLKPAVKKIRSEEYTKGFTDCMKAYKRAEGNSGNLEEIPSNWSEEDERILKGIIGLIDHNQHYGVGNKEMLAWLKSLRPQPHWKPSEEQMNSLNFGINALEEEGYDETASEIKELYEQLKKLMEDEQ